MEDLDILYKALDSLRRVTAEEQGLVRLRAAFSRAASPEDELVSVRHTLTVDGTWVDAIEKGLPFIGEAIREERQFIRQEGNVLPVEQARRVSKDSVEHLARHGNLISHAPADGETVTPDRLLVVEKLSDYAVYENRFLYMLLCLLRDFVSLRLGRIRETISSWDGHMTLSRRFQSGRRQITFDLSYAERITDDPLTQVDEETRVMLSRIETLEGGIAVLLSTPLMQEVAKVPMIKPPITRTNALRMDNALRMSLWLYDTVAAYQGAGYTVEDHQTILAPLPDGPADEVAELYALTSFLTYAYGNRLTVPLAEGLERERREAEEAEAAAHEARIAAMKHSLSESGVRIEDYVLALEDRGPYMDMMKNRLHEAREEIAARQAAVDRAAQEVAAARAEADACRLVADERLADMQALEEQLYEEVKMFESRRIRDKLDVEAIAASYARKREQDLKDDETARASALEAEHARAEAEREALVRAYEEKLAEKDAQLAALAEGKAAVEEDRARIRRDLIALRAKHRMYGDIDDYSSKERYRELLGEVRALDALVGRSWRIARRRMRNEYLWNELTRREPDPAPEQTEETHDEQQ